MESSCFIDSDEGTHASLGPVFVASLCHISLMFILSSFILALGEGKMCLGRWLCGREHCQEAYLFAVLGIGRPNAQSQIPKHEAHGNCETLQAIRPKRGHNFNVVY